MESEAKNLAREQRSELDTARADVFQASSKRNGELSEAHQETLKAIRQRHEAELEAASQKVTELKAEEAGLASDLRNAQAEPEVVEVLQMERQKQTDANAELTTLHEKTEGLQKTQGKVRREFEEIELQINSGETAIEDTQEELDQLLAADNASEDTLLGFLRRNRPNWASNIGRLVAPETLLRTDLSPAIGDGSDLYGIAIDLEKLKAGRFSSEEAIQQEIKLLRKRLNDRATEVAEDKKALEKKRKELAAAKQAQELHDAAIAMAKNRKSTADQNVLAAERRVADSKRNATATTQTKLNDSRTKLGLAIQAVDTTKKAHHDELADTERLHKAAVEQAKQDETNALKQIEIRKTVIETDLTNRLAQIGKDRDACLASKGVSVDVLNGIRQRISGLDTRIEEANGLRAYVGQYRDWLESSWSQRTAKHQEWQTADGDEKRHKRQELDLRKEWTEVLKQMETAIEEAGKFIDAKFKLQTRASHQMRELSHWPTDNDTLNAGIDSSLDIELMIAERKRLNDSLEEHREKIRLGVEEIRRQMSSVAGTGPEKFYLTAQGEIGTPRPGKEYEWLEVFRNWFNHEHETNRTSLLQLGKTMAQNISYFWKSLNDFQQSVDTFGRDLKSNLAQGRIFDSIADVSAEIKAHVDTQNYWEAVGNLHREYEAWHTHGNPSLPPASFVEAAEAVAKVVGEDKGLVADPVDLISLKISANVNNQGEKTASNEHELASMSSNGLSYIILCVILIGFVNRIRRSEPVVVPFVVDELKDLSFANAKTLLELLTRNNITMISAFPDVDLDLAELFDRNYKILPGRKVGLIDLDDESEEDLEEEAAHV